MEIKGCESLARSCALGRSGAATGRTDRPRYVFGRWIYAAFGLAPVTMPRAPMTACSAVFNPVLNRYYHANAG
jgi:hypothetical protein